jgi:hypothetical protein
MARPQTPGPWIAVKAEGTRGDRANKCGIFEVKAQQDIDAGFGHRSVVSERGSLFEADAHLIAAAPELVTALERIVALIDMCDADAWDCRVVCRETLADAREAIAKARGE